MHEDVITQLSRIADLKVISRSSVMGYASDRPNVRQIGRELGVATILEGSVRREGSTIRVTVQLIDAETDEHLWAENYDETMTGILELQSRLATRIARELRGSLTARETAALADRGTTHPRAWEHWVLGTALWDESSRTSDFGLLERAEAEFRAALALDAGFAQASASLANTLAVRRPGQSEASYRATADTIRALLEDALARAPEDPAVRLANGRFLHSVQMDEPDWEGALLEYRRALVGLPGSAEVHALVAGALLNLGRWEEAWEFSRRAADLDPRSASNLLSTARVATWVRRYEEAEELLARAAVLSAATGLARAIHFDLLQLDLLRGRLGPTTLQHVDAWLAVQPALTPAQMVNSLIGNRPEVLLVTDRFDEVILSLSREAEDPGRRCDCFNEKGWLHRIRGRAENARATWDSLNAQWDEELPGWDTPDNEARPRAQLARNYARAGRRNDAFREMTRFAAIPLSDARRQDISYRRAQTYAELGEVDLLVAELDDLLSRPALVSAGALRTFATFMLVRDQPGFQALMARHPVE